MSNIVLDPMVANGSQVIVKTNSVGSSSATAPVATRGFFYIPLIDTVTKEVKSYLTCEKINDSAYRYHVYNKAAILKTASLSETQSKNIRPLLGMLAYFERQINGKNSIVYEGAAGKYRFTDVYIKRGNLDTDVLFKKQRDFLEKKLDMNFCKRVLLDVLYLFNGYDYDLVIVLSDCITLTLPDVVVTSSIGGSSSGGVSMGMFTGSISGSPLGAAYSSSGGDPNSPTYNGLPTGFNGDPWSVYFAALTSSGGISAAVNYLTNALALSSDQVVWLSQNQEIANELSTFLLSSPNASTAVARDQIINMMNNLGYYTFVSNYAINHTGTSVWWENDTFLDDAANINFDLDPVGGGTYKNLTAAEKALVKQYPVAAVKISGNKTVAEDAVINIFGNNFTNDRSDAVRHAFFNAMNERDCGYLYGQNAGVAKLFSDAHESETPSQWTKEKDMDIFNNTVGQSVGHAKSWIYADIDLLQTVMDKMRNGDLVYLSPIWFTDPNFTFTHGITSATTLTPTN